MIKFAVVATLGFLVTAVLTDPLDKSTGKIDSNIAFNKTIIDFLLYVLNSNRIW